MRLIAGLPPRVATPLRCTLLAALGVAAAVFVACTGEAREAADSRAAAATSPVATATVATPVPTIEPVTTLLFTGDVIPARCTYTRLREIGSYDAAFDALRDLLVSADITAGSLDTSLGQSASPIGCVETFNLASPPEFTGALQRAGFDVLAHATNHAKDCGDAACGDAAMLETIWNLKSAGILPVGSGGDLASARVPAIIERNGVRFAFLAYDDIAAWYHATDEYGGTAPLDLEMADADVAAAKQVADVVIVIPHWGIEYTTEPSDRQRDAARAMAAAGADLVLGNHPHWVQAHEQIGNTFVAYAMGNFVFDQDWSIETQQGAMLEVTFTGARITGTRYLPVRLFDNHQPRLAEPAEAAQIIDRVERASADLAP